MNTGSYGRSLGVVRCGYCGYCGYLSPSFSGNEERKKFFRKLRERYPQYPRYPQELPAATIHNCPQPANQRQRDPK